MVNSAWQLGIKLASRLASSSSKWLDAKPEISDHVPCCCDPGPAMPGPAKEFKRVLPISEEEREGDPAMRHLWCFSRICSSE